MAEGRGPSIGVPRVAMHTILGPRPSALGTLMARYIKRFSRIGLALGPSEERSYGLWVGYDIAGVDDDLSPLGLTKVEDWSPEELARHGVTAFARIEPDDAATYEKLGIGRKSR